MSRFYLFALFCCLSSCNDVLNQEKGEIEYFTVEEQMFDKYINQKNMPEKPNLMADKLLVNNSYPFEIALYRDNKFYYDLPNLGEGSGRWWYEKGRIRFYAERSLFDMHMSLKAKSENAQTVQLKFSDRFGPNALMMNKQNFQ